eukprot:GHRR01004842.1.p1 GENE.GHRR01004842.1~~GHRR01004842.1.p1  ORF type:complete len:405 (+),score=137.00 GHRR01004842.1:287-1501(+)
MAPSIDNRLNRTSNQPNMLRAIFNRRNIVGLVGAAVVGPGLQLGSAGAFAGFFAFKWIYSKTEQYVPFTKRRHVILMPSVAEAMLGAYLYETFLVEQHQKGTLVDASERDTMLVLDVAKRLIKVVQEGHGGGYQKHTHNFKWSVSVVKEPIMNAFVFPGGYIVVYTGLLDLLRRDYDLLAMVMGHEIAHALARHNTEKLSLGLAISIVSSMAMAAIGAGPDQEQQRKRQQQLEYERMRRGYHRTHARYVADGGDDPVPWGAAGAAGGYYPSVPRPDVPPISYKQQQKQHKRGGQQGPAGDEPPQPPSWMSEKLLATLSNVLLELPFSRRAETEADLIGLKLMTLAGFNPHKAPEAFRLLASKQHWYFARWLQQVAGVSHKDFNFAYVFSNRQLGLMDWPSNQRH